MADLLKAASKGDQKALTAAMFSAPVPPAYSMEDLDALLPDDMKTRDLVIPVGLFAPRTKRMDEANSKHYYYFRESDAAKGTISDSKNHTFSYLGLYTIARIFRNHKTAFIFCPAILSDDVFIAELVEVIRNCNLPFLCVTDNKDILRKFEDALGFKTATYKSIVGKAFSFSSLPCHTNAKEEMTMSPKVLQVQVPPTSSSTSPLLTSSQEPKTPTTSL